jgi:hypothetical protein
LFGLVAAVVAGCYRPATEQPCSVTCGPGASCPGGLTCDNGICKSDGACPVDAPMQDVVIDDPPGEFCYGHPNGLFRTCFVEAPVAGLNLNANMTIDTDQSCDFVLGSTTAPVCVLARSAIHIPLGVTLRAYGSRPLVLISAGTFDLGGKIDVASDVGGPDTRGAGGSPTVCAAPGPALLKAGGAGGSFGTIGGVGGGGNGQSFAGTPAAATPAISSVRGGCSGGVGQGGSGGEGLGGGAVYIITPTLVLDGAINASGAPGQGGAARGGGGGGGAGGLIGIDATDVTGTGTGYLIADGGGGGCGGDAIMTGGAGFGSLRSRPPGGCKSAAISAGNGAYGGLAAESGSDGGANEGGGGGGGGAGIIALFPPTLTVDDRSPP